MSTSINPPRIQQALDWIVPILESLETPFQITGGFAAHLYGASREVNDIDIDLPRVAFDALEPMVKAKLDFGPVWHRDSTWNLYVMTVDYAGQLLDFTAAEGAEVCNKNTGEYESLEMNFDEVVWMERFGHRLPVQKPADLMSYKSKIAYEEEKHLQDVGAVNRYLAELSR